MISPISLNCHYIVDLKLEVQLALFYIEKYYADYIFKNIIDVDGVYRTFVYTLFHLHTSCLSDKLVIFDHILVKGQDVIFPVVNILKS